MYGIGGPTTVAIVTNVCESMGYRLCLLPGVDLFVISYEVDLEVEVVITFFF